ncbi:tRNA (adenosine(37)-N6)-dimethylallyltransferase MiaA [Acidobacterium sp. S8]|uniref:tRNA (adenosine(37)-N6)-dimethylallyltransferase MiaA n=1 Tax=Acidobacterium sp. S8 TaxID=1641854 RepID=UPI00352EAB28
MARLVEPLVIVLAGPTASGKTSLSLHLAERFGGEIVSCDSVAVYRDMEIGTAKPDKADRERLPHHLIDVVDPTENYTAGDYSRDARAALSAIVARGHLPIITGGTGLYLRALVDGLFAGPQRSESLRERLKLSDKRRGPGWLYKVLMRLDPKSAERIHPNDKPKLIRALEVCIAAKQPMSQVWEQGRDALKGFRILRVGLEPDRDCLYQRINRRAAEMFQNGLVEETRLLLEKYGEARPFDSLGYKQARSLLSGDLRETDAIALAQQGHRNYAKRQLTWFRREPEMYWLHGFGDEQRIRQKAIGMVEEAVC